MKKTFIAFGLLCLALALLAQTKISVKTKLDGKIKFSVTTTGAPLVSVNCLTPSGSVCTKITITGDPDSGNASFSGKADPSIMKDPNTGTYFMSYSWVNATNGAGRIDTHIAKSTDAGVSWTYVGDLYPTTSQTDTISGNTVYESNEVSKILAFDVSGTTNWIVCTYNYLKPGAGAATLLYSQRLGCAVGAGNATQGPFRAVCTTITGTNCTTRVTPQWLGTNDQVVGGGQYPIDVNMQTLTGATSALSTCGDHWREPAAIIDPVDGKLVLSLQCGTLAFQPQFVTNTAPAAGNWTWNYITGSNGFGVSADATSGTVPLCSYTSSCALSSLRLTEFDFRANAAGTGYGTAVSIVSVVSGRFSTGCVFAEMDMTSRPYTFKKTGGNIIVDATAMSSDSSTGGPGSCTYAPAVSLIVTHKTVASGKITDSYPMLSTLNP